MNEAIASYDTVMEEAVPIMQIIFFFFFSIIKFLEKSNKKYFTKNKPDFNLCLMFKEQTEYRKIT